MTSLIDMSEFEAPKKRKTKVKHYVPQQWTEWEYKEHFLSVLATLEGIYTFTTRRKKGLIRFYINLRDVSTFVFEDIVETFLGLSDYYILSTGHRVVKHKKDVLSDLYIIPRIKIVEALNAEL